LWTNIIRSLAAQLGGEVNDDDVPESSPLRRGCSLQVRGETQGRRRSPLFARRFYIHPHASYNGRSRMGPAQSVRCVRMKPHARRDAHHRRAALGAILVDMTAPPPRPRRCSIALPAFLMWRPGTAHPPRTEAVQAVIDTSGKAAHSRATSKQQPLTFAEPVFRDVLTNGFSQYWAFSARTFAAFLLHLSPQAEVFRRRPSKVFRRRLSWSGAFDATILRGLQGSP